MTKYAVGIDLGTTNSVCCTMSNGKFETIKIQRKDTLSSVILYKDGKISIGEKAKKRSVLFSKNYIKSSKTYMGEMDKIWEIEDKEFTPTDVATEILRVINESAQSHFKTTEKISAVITVPAYFTAKQREETKKAAELAGFEVKSILPEPIAAALAYGFEDRKKQKLFVVDLGGGTFDVSVLKVDGEEYDTMAVDGDKRLGGDDFDKILLEIFLKDLRKEFGIDLSSQDKSNLDTDVYGNVMQTLTEKAEEVKKDLSKFDMVDVEMVNLFSYNNELINLSMKITREEFEEEASDLMYKISKTIKKCLDDTEIDRDKIDKIVLVGGSTNIPAVQQLVIKELGKQPYSNKDLSKLVAMGAALKACDDNSKIQIRDIVVHSLGIEVVDDKFSIIIPRNTKYPVEMTESYTTVADNQEKLSIKVFEGENEEDINENEFYSGFLLENIEQAPKGIPEIDVTFRFDENQILHVTAVDKKTKATKSEAIKIDRF